MTSILCQWLNEDVKLSTTIDANTFAEQFANGYLFAELLTKHNLPCDVRTFSKSRSSEAKLNNFLKLEPTFRALRIPFDANMAKDIMDAKHGVASRLAYQLFVQLSQVKSGDFTWSEKMRAAGSDPETHFASTLRQSTKRQVDLDHRSIEERFKERQRQQEEKALRAQRAEEQRAAAIRKQKHQATLERSREIKRQYDERVKQFAAPKQGQRITQQRRGPPVASLAKTMRQAHLAGQAAAKQVQQDLEDLSLFESRHGLDREAADRAETDDRSVRGTGSASTTRSTAGGKRGATPPTAQPRPPSRPRTGSARPRVASARRQTSTESGSGGGSGADEGGATDDGTAPSVAQTGKSHDDVHAAVMSQQQQQQRPVTSASTTKLFDNQFVATVRSRKREEEAARTERERRRKRMLVEQLELQNQITSAMEERMREVQQRRQSHRDMRIASQLTKLKAEKNLMRENRIQRQREARERREKDFAAALDREAELARRLKQEHMEELQRKAEHLNKLKAQKEAEERAETAQICREAVQDVVSLALKKIEYAHQYGGKDVPIATWLNWKQLFIKGYPVDVAEDSDHPAHDHLDDCELFHYLDLEGIWGSVAATDTEKDGAAADPNTRNPILHHVVTSLIESTYPTPEPWSPAHVPHHKLRCVVSSKPCADVVEMLQRIAHNHNASLLDAQKLVDAAVHAAKVKETTETKEPELDQVIPPEELTPAIRDRVAEAEAEAERLQREEEEEEERKRLREEEEAQSKKEQEEQQQEGGKGGEGGEDEKTGSKEQTPAEKPADADGSQDNKQSGNNDQEKQETTAGAEDEAAAASSGDAADKEAAKASPEEPAAADENSSGNNDGGAAGDADDDNDNDDAGERESEVARPKLSLRAKLGNLALERLRKGEPVEDRVLCAIVVHGIRQLGDNSNGWILLNFPRTRQQAELLERCLSGQVVRSRPPTPTTTFPREDSLLLKSQVEVRDEENDNTSDTVIAARSRRSTAVAVQSLQQQKNRRSIDAVLALDMSDEAVLNRVLGRRVDPATGRSVHMDNIDTLLHSAPGQSTTAASAGEEGPNGPAAAEGETATAAAAAAAAGDGGTTTTTTTVATAGADKERAAATAAQAKTSAETAKSDDDLTPPLADSPLIRLKEVEDPDLASDKAEQLVATYNAQAPAMLEWYDRHFGIVQRIAGSGATSSDAKQQQAVEQELDSAVTWALETETREMQSAWSAMHAEEEQARRTLSQPVVAVEGQAEADAAVFPTPSDAHANGHSAGAAGDDNGQHRDADGGDGSKPSATSLAPPSAGAKGRKKSAGSSRPSTRGSRPASKKSGKGSKGGSAAGAGDGGQRHHHHHGHVPDAEHLKRSASAVKTERKREAEARVGAAGLHRSRDEEPQYVELEVEPELAKGLVPLWDVMERCYIGDVKQMLRNLRHCRQNSSESLSALEREMTAFLMRPDAGQEYVNSWQRAFNEVPDKLRRDEACKAELYQRVEELKDALYDICDQRKQEAEELLQQRVDDLMTDDQCNIALNAFVGLMQAEVDRYVQTQQLLADTYSHMEGKLADQVASTHPTLPLVDMHHKPNERTSARTKRKNQTAEVVTREDGVSLQLRQSMDDAGDTLALNTAMTLALETVPKRVPPRVQREEAARLEAEEEARRKAEEEAAAKKKKKGKKTAEPEPTPAPEPTAEELAAKKAEEERRAFVAAAQDEHFAAAETEDKRFRARLHLILHVAQGMLKQLREPASQCLERLEAAIGQRYRKEHESVDRLCEQARSAVEAEVKIYRELVFIDANFAVNQEVVVSPVPQLPRPPTPVEDEHYDSFTVAQARRLYQELMQVAPSGFIPRADMLDLLERLRQQPACAGALPAKYASLQRREIESALAEHYTPESDWLDWRMFVVDACAVPEPTTEELVASFAALYALNTHGTVTWDEYHDARLWFAPDLHVPAEEAHSPQPFNRGQALKNLLFDVFASPALSHFGREIDYVNLFMYLCRCRSGRTGLSRVAALLSVATGTCSLQALREELASALAAAAEADEAEEDDADADDSDQDEADQGGEGSAKERRGKNAATTDAAEGGKQNGISPSGNPRMTSAPNVSVTSWSPTHDTPSISLADADAESADAKGEAPVAEAEAEQPEPEAEANASKKRTGSSKAGSRAARGKKSSGSASASASAGARTGVGSRKDSADVGDSSGSAKGRDTPSAARSRRGSVNPSSGGRKSLRASASRGPSSRRASKLSLKDEDGGEGTAADTTNVAAEGGGASATAEDMAGGSGGSGAETPGTQGLDDDDVVLQVPIPVSVDVLMALVAHGMREVGEVETEARDGAVAGAVELHPMLSLTHVEATELLAHVEAAQAQLLDDEEQEGNGSAEGADEGGGQGDARSDRKAGSERSGSGKERSGRSSGSRSGSAKNRGAVTGEREGFAASSRNSKEAGSRAVPEDDDTGLRADGEQVDDAEEEEQQPVVTVDTLVFGPCAPNILTPLRTKFARCTRL